MDDGSRTAVAVLEALGMSRNLLLNHGLEMSRRPEVSNVETVCAPMWPRHPLVSISLIVDLHAGHGLNWSIELWWRLAEWTIVGNLYWTAPFPHHGWVATWESRRTVIDLASFLEGLENATNDVVTSIKSIDLSNPSSWQVRSE